MGDVTKAACHTCKIIFDLGYGSYSTDAIRRQRFPVEHKDHEVSFWSGDYEWGRKDGTLWGIGGWGERGSPIVTDEASYARVDRSHVHVNYPDR